MISIKHHYFSVAIVATAANQVVAQYEFSASDNPCAKKMTKTDCTQAGDGCEDICRWDCKPKPGVCRPTRCNDFDDKDECTGDEVLHLNCTWAAGYCLPPGDGPHPGPTNSTGMTCDGTTSSCAELLAGKGNVYIVSPDHEDKACNNATRCISAADARTHKSFMMPPDCTDQDCPTVDRSFGDGSTGEALLFMPGDYKELPVWLDVYQEMIGLGSTPDKVKFTCESAGGSEVGVATRGSNEGKCMRNNTLSGAGPTYLSIHNGVTDIFWRGASNFYVGTAPGQMAPRTQFTVSQAAPLRRFKLDGGLYTHYDGASSGYYLAQGKIGGKFEQYGQQYYSRNCNFTDFDSNGGGAAWNMNNVFENCNIPVVGFDATNKTDIGSKNRAGMVQVFTNGQSSDDQTVVFNEHAGAMAEKPYIYLNEPDKNWNVCNPSVKIGSEQKNGPDEIETECQGEQINFSKVLVINPDDVPHSEAWADLMALVGDGKDYSVIVLTPGLYEISDTVTVPTGVIILGIGYPTLQFAIQDETLVGLSVPSTQNVRLAGFMLQPKPADDEGFKGAYLKALIQFGANSKPPQGYDGAGIINDVFFRTFGWAEKMLWIGDPYVIVDHVWAWTADHASNTKWIGHANNGIYVDENAKQVTVHGAFVEHTSQSNIVWDGEGGSLIFQQTEIGYDYRKNFHDNTPAYVKASGASPLLKDYEIYQDGKVFRWGTNSTNQFSGLQVSANVTDFKAAGVGIYMYNRSGPVTVANAISAPKVSCDHLQQMFVWTIPVSNAKDPKHKGAGTDYQDHGTNENVIELGMGKIEKVILCNGDGVRPSLDNIDKNMAYHIFRPGKGTNAIQKDQGGY